MGNVIFKFQTFSKKQMKVLTWWLKDSPHSECDAIICDGSVRAGKTLIMSLSYIIWSMSTFNNSNFGMTGKTISSFKRNVWLPLRVMLRGRGYKVRKMPDSNDAYVISRKGVHNTYYIFGGRDERSQDLVQGFTASGFLFDEVALMPRSFVEQACARCSVDGAKLWFNCNPDGPFHWFKLEWLDKLKEKNALHIHFLMTDNPSLSQKTLDVYKRRYSGIFYDRFILGLWVMAEGVIYSMFKKSFILHKVPADVKINKRWVGVDYGQANATVFLLIGLGSDNKLYILDEYYHEGKSADVQYSPRGYSKQYFKWLIKNGVEGVPVQREHVFIDPSAKGFITQLREDGERKIREADNEVLKGIEMTSSLLEANMLYVLSKCEYTIREFSAYRWDAKAQTERGEDIPVKQNDHCMDALRYVVNGNRMLLKTLLKTRIQQEVKQGLINKNIA